MYIVTLETWYSLSSFCPAVALSLPSFFSPDSRSLAIIRRFVYTYVTFAPFNLLILKPIAGADFFFQTWNRSFLYSLMRAVARSVRVVSISASRTNFPSNTFHVLFVPVVKNLSRQSIFLNQRLRSIGDDFPNRESHRSKSPSAIKFHTLILHQPLHDIHLIKYSYSKLII